MDWRHGADATITDQGAAERAETGSREFQNFALTPGALPPDNLFAQPDTWQLFEYYAQDVGAAPMSFRAAATYLERTDPKEYERNRVLTSLVVLIGSTTNLENKDVAQLVLGYLSENADAVFSRLSGSSDEEPNRQVTPGGEVRDESSRGCLQLVRAPKDAPDAFDYVVVVKTPFAGGGRGCR